MGIIRASLQLLHQLCRLPRCPFILRHAIPRRVASLILEITKENENENELQESCQSVTSRSWSAEEERGGAGRMAGFAAARMALNLNDGAHRLCCVSARPLPALFLGCA